MSSLRSKVRLVTLCAVAAPALRTADLARLLRQSQTLRLGRPTWQGELSLAVVGETVMRRLNREFRKHDEATDVLSFPYGEIVLCYPRARRQAKQHGVAIGRELAVLFAHGLLHLRGFDHDRVDDRQRMQRAEQRLLGGPGLIALQGYRIDL